MNKQTLLSTFSKLDKNTLVNKSNLVELIMHSGMHKFNYDIFYAEKYKNYHLSRGLKLNTTPEQFADYLIHISALNIETYIEFNDDIGHAIFTYLYLNKFNQIIKEYTIVTATEHDLSWLGQNIKHVNTSCIKTEVDLCYIDIPHSSTFNATVDYYLTKAKYLVLHDIVDNNCQQVLNKWKHLKSTNNSYIEFVDQYKKVQQYRHGYGIVNIAPQTTVVVQNIQQTISNETINSYDVFDTLIGRKCGDYKRMFDIIALKAGIINFKEKRIKAESCCTGNYNYDDIYNNFKKLFKCTDEQITDLKRIEFETELEQAYPIKQNTSKFVNCKDIVISDMYLHKEQINKMLAKCDIFPLETYVSSGGKGQGWIWPKIKQKITEHYGDNVHSDFKMPIQYKIPAKHFVNINTWQEDIISKINVDMATYMKYLRLSTQYDDQNMNQFKNDWIEIYFPILISMICIVKELIAKGPVHLMYRDCAAIYELLKDDYDVYQLKASRKCFYDKPAGFIKYMSKLKQGTIFDYFGSGNSYYDFVATNVVDCKCDYRLFYKNHYTKEKHIDSVVTDIAIHNQDIFNKTFIMENFGNPGEAKTISYDDAMRPIYAAYEFSDNVKTVITDLLNKIKEDKAIFNVKMSNIFHLENIAKLNPEFYKVFFEASKTMYNT